MKLIQYVDGQFGLKSDEIIFRGNAEEVRTAAMAMGMLSSEFEMGIFDLSPEGPNVSYFGLNKCYLYSERQF